MTNNTQLWLFAGIIALAIVVGILVMPL